MMGTKFPATLMVMGVVSNDGDVMPPHTFAKRLMIDTYKHLKEVVKPWTSLHVTTGLCASEQLEGGPGLVHGEPPEGLAQGDLPPSSPECNALDT